VIKVPSLSYVVVVKALQRDGWTIVRQKEAINDCKKEWGMNYLKISVPAHNPIKCSTLAHILKQASMNLKHFNKLLRKLIFYFLQYLDF